MLAEGDYYGADRVDTSELLFEGEYTADQLKKRVEQMLAYIEDEDGGMASNEIFRAALERMGFDGIIDNAPSLRFQNMDLGRETKHYIVFSPNQVKQSDAVTYDNEGNVIPLSERANRADKDMRYRQGDGRYTDEELALINDPAARLYGESFRTKKQQKQYAERVRNHMRKKANELAEKLHLPVEIIESEEDMAKLQGKKAKAKGWYEVKSGKIVLVLPNNESVADIVETVLH